MQRWRISAKDSITCAPKGRVSMCLVSIHVIYVVLKVNVKVNYILWWSHTSLGIYLCPNVPLHEWHNLGCLYGDYLLWGSKHKVMALRRSWQWPFHGLEVLLSSSRWTYINKRRKKGQQTWTIPNLILWCHSLPKVQIEDLFDSQLCIQMVR
jgi:hypothetical protein